MSDELETESPRKYVRVNTLEGLIEGWESRVSRHEYDGTPEEYQAYMEAFDTCIENLEDVIEFTAEEDDEL